MENILQKRAVRGDRAKFLAVLDKAPDGEEEFERAPDAPTPESVIAGQLEPVVRFARRLKELLESDDVEEFATNTAGGDLLFLHANGIFAEIKFFRKRE